MNGWHHLIVAPKLYFTLITHNIKLFTCFWLTRNLNSISQTQFSISSPIQFSNQPSPLPNPAHKQNYNWNPTKPTCRALKAHSQERRYFLVRIMLTSIVCTIRPHPSSITLHIIMSHLAPILPNSLFLSLSLTHLHSLSQMHHTASNELHKSSPILLCHILWLVSPHAKIKWVTHNTTRLKGMNRIKY